MGKKLAPPTHLNYRDWDKQKGIIAKIVKKETGITAALKEFEKEYDNWGWGRVDDSSLKNYFEGLKGPHKDISVTELKFGLKDCKAKDGYLSKVQGKLDAVKKLALANAAEFKKSSLIPSSSRVFLETMAKECDQFVNKVKAQIEDSDKRITEALTKAGVK